MTSSWLLYSLDWFSLDKIELKISVISLTRLNVINKLRLDYFNTLSLIIIFCQRLRTDVENLPANITGLGIFNSFLLDLLYTFLLLTLSFSI